MAEQGHHSLTKDQFMSQPLAAFINDNGESNFTIAKKIVTFFEDRDHGKYAAIVANSELHNYRGWITEGKTRIERNCRGKWIKVYKQCPSRNKKDYKKETVDAVVKGLIATNDEAIKIGDILCEIFGGYWSVYKIGDNGSAYFTYDEYYIKHKGWTIWRHL